MSKINRKSLFAATGGLAAVLAFAAFRHNAQAQVQPPAVFQPTKVAYVNLRKLFTDSTAMKNAKTDLENKKKINDGLAVGHRAEMAELDAARGKMTVGGDGWRQTTFDMETKDLDFQTKTKISELTMQREQASAVKLTFDSISSAVKTVSTTKGIDLVMVDNGDDIPPEAAEMSLEALGNAIQSHLIIYSAQKLDITTEVSAEMARVAAMPPAPPAPPVAPAPAPGH